jgi:ethanolamine utilization protein EutN
VILAQVVGNVVATRKHEALHASKMMLVLPVDPEGRPGGEEFMAADTVGAGPGERVLVVVEGRSACQAANREDAPLDAAIVGIVDRIDLGDAA